MKKTILKTFITTICVFLLLGMAAFGIASLVSPRSMMDFTSDIGLEEMSGDFAFREYERSDDVDCLARAFVVAAQLGRDKKAEERFSLLYAHEKFAEHCEEQDALMKKNAEDPSASETEKQFFGKTSYRSYVCGMAARIRYRLKSTEISALIDFAVGETEEEFPALCAAYQLAAEAHAAHDEETVSAILSALSERGIAGEVAEEIQTLTEDVHA